MKKILLGLFIAVAFMSCKGDDGRDGRDGVDGFANMQTVDIRIEKDAWKFVDILDDGTTRRYYHDIAISELTESIFDNGTVIPYIIYDDPQVGDTKRMLPCVVQYKDMKEGKEVKWKTTFSLEYTWDGYIVFYADQSAAAGLELPVTTDYTVTLLWN